MAEQIIDEKIGTKIVALGTGGTIAGTAESSDDHTGYTAAQIGIDALMHCVPGLKEALAGRELVSEQIAQLDSKDMDFDVMLRLAQRCVHFLAQPEVKGIVITHGTDTLEETVYFLHRVIPRELQAKPIVFTCAMRPATSSEADGPRNLRDAFIVASDAKARGVLAVCAGDVHHAFAVQKIHTYALNAFSSGDAEMGELGLMAQVLNGAAHWTSAFDTIFMQKEPVADIKYTQSATELIASTSEQAIDWARVEIVLNHSHATGSIVRALIASSTPQDPPHDLLRGIVVAGTGNGTVSESLQSALDEAKLRGVEVIMSSRCSWGGVRGSVRAGSGLSPVKARIELVLKLLDA